MGGRSAPRRCGRARLRLAGGSRRARHPDSGAGDGDLPGFAAPTVAGHHGQLRSLDIGDHRVLVLIGRTHLYEGRSPAEVVHPVRTAVIAGARRRHLDQRRRRPRPGDEARPGGADPGPPQLDGRLAAQRRRRLRRVTGGASSTSPSSTRPSCERSRRQVDPTLSEGVYAGLNGPHYETPAEVAMLRSLGADLVGMSTALEAIAAHHLGASVLGISLVTNLAAGVSPTPLDHEEVLAAGAAAAPYLVGLLSGVLSAL